MESADFVHFDDEAETPRLTLIHVNGSGSKAEERKISVADYEVVVGQAIKNLRNVDRGLLREKLEANQGGQLRNAVWHNGARQANRDGILNALANAGSNIDKSVVVLQPRVCRSRYNEIRALMDDGDRSSSEVLRMKQLDALLLGARADCYGLSAAFSVIAKDDL